MLVRIQVLINVQGIETLLMMASSEYRRTGDTRMTEEKLMVFIRDMLVNALELGKDLRVLVFDEGTLYTSRKFVIRDWKTGQEETFVIKVQKKD